MENQEEKMVNSSEEVVVDPTAVGDTDSTEEKKFTQEEVNDIVRKRLDKQKSSFLKNYNVESEEELTDLLKKALGYEELKSSLDTEKKSKGELVEKLAFLENNINQDKVDDIKTYFKGKELELNSDNLKNLLDTHKEWVNEKQNITTILPLGSDNTTPKPQVSEKEQASKLFGLGALN